MAGSGGPAPGSMSRWGYMLVSPGGPDDGGDFGPRTPGTRTAGIQEALDAACATDRNVFIAGVQGEGRPSCVYQVAETIHVPPRQGFRIDGGPHVLAYTGRGDAVVIDSCMDCWYRFGLITSRSDGAVVRLQPQHPVPIDGMRVITDSVFEFSSLVGGGRFDLAARRVAEAPRGTGLLLDGRGGPIVFNRIFAVAVLLCDIGVHLRPGPGGAISHNVLRVTHNHQNRVGLQLGDEAAPARAAAFNRVDMSLDAEDVPEATGAIVAGSGNLLTLDCARMASGRDLVLTRGAHGNLVQALAVPSGITLLAEGPNRIVVPGAGGLGIGTPAVPPTQEAVRNEHPHPIEAIILAPGTVHAWTLVDRAGNRQRVAAPLRAGERFILDCGEALGFEYREPPAWRWRALP
jgi:hypothetical protein